MKAKKLLSIFLFVLPLFLFLPLAASATTPLVQEKMPAVEINPDDMPRDYPLMYPPPTMNTGLYELAIFDKKGGAYIAGKIVFDKSDKDLLEDLNIFIPGKDAQFVNVVHEQYVYKETCYPWKYPRPLPAQIQGEQVEPTFGNSTPSAPGEEISVPPRPSIMPDGDEYCPKQYTQVYSTVDPEVTIGKKGVNVRISATAEDDTSQEALLFLYRLPSVAFNIFSNHYFRLDTVQLPFTTASTQVGILVKDGLHLRGAPGFTADYGGGYVPSFRPLEKARNLNREDNQELTNLSNEIAYQGMIRRGDSDVTPDSSLTLSGVYGTHLLMLYVKEIFLGIIFVLVLIAAILWAIKYFFKNHLNLRLILITVVATFFVTIFLVAFILLLFFYFRTTIGFGYSIPV
ncbi:hypothetical protein HYW55_00950 [Candidatus Gottesmanbacteria bacterium]|nr:hypothetical protein [Candidatus Gottesmanbacteria bacterium]